MDYEKLPRVTLKEFEANIHDFIKRIREYGESFVVTENNKDIVMCRYSREEELNSMPKWKDLEHG